MSSVSPGRIRSGTVSSLQAGQCITGKQSGKGKSLSQRETGRDQSERELSTAFEEVNPAGSRTAGA